MKRLFALLLALAVLLSVPAAASAENVETRSEVVGNVIRLQRTGEPVTETQEGEMILETLFDAENLEYAFTMGWITIRLDRIWISDITVTGKDFLRFHPGAFLYAPYVLIRMGFTIENGADQEITIPSDWGTLTSNFGESYSMVIGGRDGGAAPSCTLPPKSSQTGFLFFRLYYTPPEDLEFFTVCFRDEPGVATWPHGFCVELLPEDAPGGDANS